VDEEAHEEHPEAGVVSVLAEEGAEVVGASQEVEAAASHREEEAVREVDSQGDVVDHLCPSAACCMCRYLGVFGFASQVFELQ
jgi:hypothetical protein